MNDINDVLPDIKLRFNINHPNLEDCYAFGYEAAKADLSEEENPFELYTEEYEQWSEGWWAGFYEEEPIYVESDVEDSHLAANDAQYTDHKDGILVKVLEITGVIVVTAFLGFQLFEMVA